MDDRDPRSLAVRYGPFALLALVVVFMFWVRMRPIGRVITGSAVFFSGNDPWYHDRMVHMAVYHFPSGTPFDPWSYFPYGTGHHSGFGGLFDQIIAFVALVVGLGSPSDHLIDVVTAIAPSVFGALTAVPTYYIGRRLTDRWWALVGAGLLALVGGGILSRTIVGTADHQSAEALFGTIAVAGFVYAILAAYRESPMLEDVRDRNWGFLRAPVLAGIVGGIAIASYLMLWPPGVMLLFTFGVFVVIQLSREHLAGVATDHLALATVVSMATVAILTLGYARTYTLESTAYSLLQPMVALVLAAGTLVLFWLSRYVEREGYDRQYYPPAVAGLIGLTLAAMWIVFPEGISLLRQLVERVYSLGLLTSSSALTVAEIQPPSLATAFHIYGAFLVLGTFGFLLLVYHVVRENRPVELLVVLWSLSMTAAYFTEARFGYYFAVNVALLSGYGIWRVLAGWLHVDFDLERMRDVELYQVLGVLIILVLIVPGNVVAMSGQQPTWQTSKNLGGTNHEWYNSLQWMQGNTPAEQLNYYGQHARPEDGDFAYPPGAYGVMSWWDYGHWITVMGHRIPDANPFQEGPRASSAYFLSSNESHANLVLDALPSTKKRSDSVATMTTPELRRTVANQSAQQSHENTRYVMIDDQMAGDKFGAIATWTGPGTGIYFQRQRYQLSNQNVSLAATNQRYQNTMLSKLYFDDASGLSHYRLVHESARYSLIGGYIQGQQVRPHTQLLLNGNWSSLSSTARQFQAAQRQRVAVQIGPNSYVYDARIESRVKTYERVPGATITGSAPSAKNGTTVLAFVQLQTHTGRNVTYTKITQTAPDGSFSMTVPYATQSGAGTSQGHTNSSVHATGQYNVIVGSFFSPVATGKTQVSEDAIYQGRQINVSVSPPPAGNSSGGSGNQSTGTGNQSQGGGNQSIGIGNQTAGSGNQTAGRLARPSSASRDLASPRRATTAGLAETARPLAGPIAKPARPAGRPAS